MIRRKNALLSLSHLDILRALEEPLSAKGLQSKTGLYHSYIYLLSKQLSKYQFIAIIEKEDLNYGKITFFKRTDKGTMLKEMFDE